MIYKLKSAPSSATGPSDSRTMSSDLIGASPKFRAALEAVEMVAPVDSAVLVQGETGTGKELIARAIHDASPRRNQRFVAVNCAAIPAALLESELFGHERGAFTGAVTQAMGRFQTADRGTLFLDEIGDLPLELQPKLLRVLEEQQFERLGSCRTLQVDVRVITATNHDLWAMTQERKFRADLYYRLNVFSITLPTSRERKDDVPRLTAHFVRKFAERQGKVIDHIPDYVMEVLKRHDWPGNIRELQNFIERAVIMSPGPELHLPSGELKRAVKNDQPTPIRTLAQTERDHIVDVLQQAHGVVGGRNGAAAQLGLPRTTLLYRMRKLGIAQERTLAFGHAISQWDTPVTNRSLRNHPMEPAWLS